MKFEEYDFAMKIYGETGYADPWRLFDSTFPQYNPSEFISTRGYRTIDMMRRDEQVKSALRYKKHAIFSTGWQVASPEGFTKDWGPTALVNKELNGIEGTFDKKLEEILIALEYGFSVSEIVYNKGDYIGIKKIEVRRPHEIRFQQDIHGNLLGVIQETPAGEINLPLNRIIIYSYQSEFSNYFGRSDLEAAYRGWWHKENAYRWLGMYMERLGIPPVFALYNPDIYNPSNVETMKSVINRIQAGTVGVIPRRTPEDLEMWSPELSQGIASVFLPAIDRFDTHIARAILMPSQLGASPETSVGSQARATIIFDLFIYMVENLRKNIAEVVQEQIVNRLVDLNFSVSDKYPVFSFIPLKEETKPELFNTWLSLVTGGIVHQTEKDEIHIRKVFEMPEIEDIEKTEPEDTEEFSVNKIKTELDSLEKALQKSIELSASNGIERAISSISKNKDLIPSIVVEIELPYWNNLEDILRKHLNDSLNAGMFSMREELSGVEKFGIRDAIESTLSFVRNIIRTRAVFYAKNLIDDLRHIVREALLVGVSNGEHEKTIAERIRGAYRSYWGEDIEAGRAKTIARTETVYAWNQGRLSEAKRPEYAGLVTGWRYNAVMDLKTTPVCRHLNGKIIKDADPMLVRLRPPNHYNCRSILEPMTITKRLKEDDYISEVDKAKGLQLAMEGFV